jgi:hypothetical protein
MKQAPQWKQTGKNAQEGKEVHDLIQAQEHGLTLFWAHKLEDMQLFIDATRT